MLLDWVLIRCEFCCCFCVVFCLILFYVIHWSTFSFHFLWLIIGLYICICFCNKVDHLLLVDKRKVLLSFELPEDQMYNNVMNFHLWNYA